MRRLAKPPFYLTYLREPRLSYAEFLEKQEKFYYPDENFKQHLAMESQAVFQKVREAMRRTAENRAKFYNRKVKGEAFHLGDIVYYYDASAKPGRMAKLEPVFKGPYRVIGRPSPVTFELRPVYSDTRLREKTAHANQLRRGHLRVPYPLPEEERGAANPQSPEGARADYPQPRKAATPQSDLQFSEEDTANLNSDEESSEDDITLSSLEIPNETFVRETLPKLLPQFEAEPEVEMPTRILRSHGPVEDLPWIFPYGKRRGPPPTLESLTPRVTRHNVVEMPLTEQPTLSSASPDPETFLSAGASPERTDTPVVEKSSILGWLFQALSSTPE